MPGWFANIDWAKVRVFFAWPDDASVWNVLNSPILVTFLAALIGWQLNRRVTKAEAKAQDAAEKAEDATDLVALKEDVEADDAAERDDDPDEAPTMSGVEDFREEASTVYEHADDFIKQQMDKADGRHRRTYRNISGASLPIKAAAMYQRKGLSQAQYEGAVELAHEWNQYRRGKAARKIVPKSTLDKMRRSLAKLRNG